MTEEELEYTIAGEWVKAQDFLRQLVIDTRRDLGLPVDQFPTKRRVPKRYRRHAQVIRRERVLMRVRLMADSFIEMGRQMGIPASTFTKAFTPVNADQEEQP